MSIVLVVALVGLVTLAAGATLLLFAGREETWRRIAGDPDLGDVSFDSLRRPITPNDALICPPGRCSARSDGEALQYKLPVIALRAALGRVIAREKYVTLVDADDSVPSERYVQRSAVLRFPDTIVVRYYALAPDRSTLALYSRSQLGLVDLGVNLKRLKRWLGRLDAEIAQVRPDAS